MARAPGNGFTHWCYADPTDSRLEMEGAGFFDKAATKSEWAPQMRHGDMITLSARDGAVIAWVSVDDGHVYLYPMARTATMAGPDVRKPLRE
jgi:hypothetical protein